MQYYKDKYEIPLWNWLMIQEKGFDLSYMLKRGKLRKKQANKLYETYMSIMLSLENINSDVLKEYTRWKSNYVAFYAEELRKGNEVIKDLEKSFRDFLNIMMKYYEKFELTEYTFNPNYKDLFAEQFKEHMNDKTFQMCLNDFKNFENIQFHHWDQYILLINMYPATLTLTVQGFFKDKYIIKKQRKIDDLVQLDEHLLTIFQDNKLYNRYQHVRYDLFDLENLQSERKENRSVFEELEQVSQIRGLNIDPKKTTLAEYQAIINVGRDRLENKPDGNN